MKKKLFTLLTLLLCVCSGAWANQTDLISGITLPDIPTGTLDLSSQTDYTADANGWIVESSPKANIGSKTWHSKLATDGGETEWTVPSGTEAPFVSSTKDAKLNRYTVRSGERTHAIRFTGAEKASFLVSRISDTRKTTIALFTISGTTQTTVSGSPKSMSTGSIGELLYDNLDSSKEYVAYIYGTDTQNSDWYEFALKAPVVLKNYTVTATSNNENYGTAAAADASLNASETTTITATPKTGYQFVSWSVEGEGSSLSSTTDNPTTLTMGTANATVTATFSAINYTITHNDATGGTYTISVAGGEATSENTTATIGQTITLAGTPTDPAHTYVVWNVKDAGDNDVTVTNNQFTMPASNVTIASVFSEPLNTLFSMTSITGPEDEIAKGGTEDVTATFTYGGAAEVYNNASKRSMLYTNNKINYINLNGSGSSYLHITLPNNVVLKAGDVISAEGAGSISWQLGKTSSASNKTCPYTLTGADDLIGATELYIKKNDGAQISSVTIQGAGVVSDLAVTSSTTPEVAIGAESAITFTTLSTGDITFTSSDEDVARVTNEGVITGVGGGTATITITQEADATYRTGIVKVTVTVPETALIKAKLNGTSDPTVTGIVDGVTAAKSGIESGNKFGSDAYVTLTLPTGYTFQTGDVLNVNIKTASSGNNTKIKVYDPENKDEDHVWYDTNTAGAVGNNKFVLPAAVDGKSSFSICRTSTNGWNAFVNYISVTRPDATITLNANGFATYSAGTDFEYVGADAYTMALDLSGEGSLTGTKITAGTKIPAGAGILFKGEAGAKVSIVNATGASALENNNLHGTTAVGGSTVSVPGDKTIYVLSGKTFKPYTGTTFAPNKAYFQVNGTTVESRTFNMSFDGETTGINAVENTNVEVNDGVFYNLNGQRVANPGKGLYIVNGKKVIMK